MIGKRIIGIDLGTSNTLIWIYGSDDIVFNEPTVLAWDKVRGRVFEIGYLAHKLIGKIPEDLEIIRPVERGTVADIEAAGAYLARAFENIRVKRKLRGAKVIFSIPSDASKVARSALEEVAGDLGCRAVFFADAAQAAAIGSGIDVFSTRGNMIVDIGGSRTNIAALAMGKIVVSRTTDYAGLAVDDAITRYIRTKHHLVIGPKTSEYIKMKIGTLLESSDNNLLEVAGKDVISGLPHSVIVSTEEISKIIVRIYDEISNCIIDALDIAPAEIASDIIHTGVTLSGGGCLLNGTRDYFQRRLSVPVHISPFPLEAVIRGIKATADQIVADKLPSEK